MSRFALLVLAVVVAALAVANYRIKSETAKAAAELAAIETALAQEREAIAVLEAEIAWLGRAERMHRLARLMRMGPRRAVQTEAVSPLADPPLVRRARAEDSPP